LPLRISRLKHGGIDESELSTMSEDKMMQLQSSGGGASKLLKPLHKNKMMSPLVPIEENR
jgi:hypothetical protein